MNGANFQNYFATVGSDGWRGEGGWVELDESRGLLWAAFGSDIRSAPFLEGSEFFPVVSGLSHGEGAALDQGPSIGHLFVAESSADQVSRLSLSSLQLTVFAAGPSYFNQPLALAASPDGSLYVTNAGVHPPRLTKVHSGGTPLVFALGGTGELPLQYYQAVIVNTFGHVYWSHQYGFNKYDATGTLLGTLPGPPSFGNPRGTAFDTQGNLYVVDNAGCKRIYKYVLPLMVASDILPGTFPNVIDPASRKTIPVAIVSRDGFDATTVDPASVTFGPNEARTRNGLYRWKDVNFDRRLDLILAFAPATSGILCGDTSVLLSGTTYDGRAVESVDSILTTHCE